MKRSRSKSFKLEELHYRHFYRIQGLDFDELADLYPESLGLYVGYNNKYHVNKDKKIDWNNINAQLCLTKTLLYHDFGITVTLLPEFLCPTVPNRLNYICWISELLDLTLNPYKNNIIVDIGTGGSLIYPLLGCRCFGWSFIGSDINSNSISLGNQNIINNQHIIGNNKFIKIVKVNTSDYIQNIINKTIQHQTNGVINITKILKSIGYSDKILLRGSLRNALISGNYENNVIEKEFNFYNNDNYDIELNVHNGLIAACMTNPPFYSEYEIIEQNQYTICTGNKDEMVTIGGEVSFIIAIIMDSLVLGNLIGWYTCMLGKKTSFDFIFNLLQTQDFLGITTLPYVYSYRLTQGRTLRWCIAWSWNYNKSDAKPLFFYHHIRDFISTFLPNETLKPDDFNLLQSSIYERINLIISDYNRVDSNYKKINFDLIFVEINNFAAPNNIQNSRSFIEGKINSSTVVRIYCNIFCSFQGLADFNKLCDGDKIFIEILHLTPTALIDTFDNYDFKLFFDFFRTDFERINRKWRRIKSRFEKSTVIIQSEVK
jgi:23S rRNA (adenine1618-N6)-methyltransferase